MAASPYIIFNSRIFLNKERITLSLGSENDALNIVFKKAFRFVWFSIAVSIMVNVVSGSTPKEPVHARQTGK